MSMNPAIPDHSHETTSARITRRADALSRRLRAVGERVFPPTAQKSLRSFTSGEVAEIVGVSDGYLRQLSLDGLGPVPELGPSGRRSYTLEQVMDLRRYLATARPKDAVRFWPRRREGDKLQVITVANFKGGSAKTTTSLYLAQGLALSGLRVLAIDLDPQASLSAMFGLQPEFDIAENATLYGAIRYDDERVAMKEIVRPTYFTGISIVPGNLELMEFEHETPAAIQRGGARAFFARVRDALDSVESDYDVVVIDCPPQLGFLTMSALSASSGVLVTVHPQMLDLMSMSQFLRMTADLLGVIRDAGANLRFDWLRFLPTRYKVGDAPQTEVIAFIRGLFGRSVLTNHMVESTAISDAGLTKQTLYEADKKDFTRQTFDRAIESMNAVNDEIAAIIQSTWGRNGKKA